MTRWHSLIPLAYLVACAATPEAEDATDPPENPKAYREAIRTICDVDRLSGTEPDDPLATAVGREDYLVEHVKDPDGRYFLTIFRTRGPKERKQMLEKEAAATQVSPCPLLASLEAAANE